LAKWISISLKYIVAGYDIDDLSELVRLGILPAMWKIFELASPNSNDIIYPSRENIFKVFTMEVNEGEDGVDDEDDSNLKGRRKFTEDEEEIKGHV
jgi:hypothetical protein